MSMHFILAAKIILSAQ